MVAQYFIGLFVGAGIIALLFFQDNGRNQRNADKELITGINKISKQIDEWEKNLDHFFIKKFQKPVVATKVENPFSNSEGKKIVAVLAQEHVAQVDEPIDWKTKYEKIEILFIEKSTMFEKLEKACENEIKNRNEFSLLQKILEEQIEKTKEKNRQLQSELSLLRNENEEYRAKIIQLENQILENQKIIQEQEIKLSN